MGPLDQGQILRPQLEASIEDVKDLSLTTINKMWTLFSRFYDDVTYDRFVQDLKAKNCVIICRDTDQGNVQGFTTIHLYDKVVDNRRIKVLFSGDTIVNPIYWGYRGLHSTFAKFAFTEWLKTPFTPFYWFLISKGYKTYLALARNFVEFWPRYDQETPAWQRKVMDTLVRSRFGDSWIPELGILRFSTPQGRLREGVVPVTDQDLLDPDIAFFVQKNPGHIHGDELCCLARFELATWLKFVGKLFTRHISLLWSWAPHRFAKKRMSVD